MSKGYLIRLIRIVVGMRRKALLARAEVLVHKSDALSAIVDAMAKELGVKTRTIHQEAGDIGCGDPSCRDCYPAGLS